MLIIYETISVIYWGLKEIAIKISIKKKKKLSVSDYKKKSFENQNFIQE